MLQIVGIIIISTFFYFMIGFVLSFDYGMREDDYTKEQCAVILFWPIWIIYNVYIFFKKAFAGLSFILTEE